MALHDLQLHDGAVDGVSEAGGKGGVDGGAKC